MHTINLVDVYTVKQLCRMPTAYLCVNSRITHNQTGYVVGDVVVMKI